LAIIIGEQDCGTSYLHTLLKDYGIVSDSKPGFNSGMHFWNSEMPEATIDATIKSYLIEGSTKIALDSTPDYFDSPVARERIKKYAPHAKMILLLRNPATRAKAAWDQNRRAGWENRTFGQAVVDELE